MSNPEWTLSEEREFMENLLNQRFDFLLVFYALVIAGAVSANSQLQFSIILIVGAVVCLFLGLSIYRANTKLTLIIDRIFQDPTHIVTQINEEAKKMRGRSLFSVRWIIGWFIPLLCFVTLASAGVLACLGRLSVS